MNKKKTEKKPAKITETNLENNLQKNPLSTQSLIDKTEAEKELLRKKEEEERLKNEPEKIERRGRKLGSTNKSKAIITDTDFNSVKSAIIMITDIIVLRMPNPAPLSEIEKMLWGNSVEQLIKKYGESILQWIPEITAGASAVIIFGSRLKKINNPEDKKDESSKGT